VKVERVRARKKDGGRGLMNSQRRRVLRGQEVGAANGGWEGFSLIFRGRKHPQTLRTDSLVGAGRQGYKHTQCCGLSSIPAWRTCLLHVLSRRVGLKGYDDPWEWVRWFNK